MANKLYDEVAIQNIAIAIRSVDGTERTYSVSEMSEAIILSGGVTLSVEETGDGVKVIATDRNGTTTATVRNSASSGPSARIGYVTLLADNWVGEASPYSQVVEIDGVTENSQVDLTPSVEQLAVFYNKDLAFVTENRDGVVTVFAIGQKPQNDYTIQVTLTEVII